MRGALVLWVAAWSTGCDAPYEPPCEVTERQSVLEGFTPRLAPTGDGEIVALGEPVEPSEDATERLVEVAVLEPGGTVLDRWSIPTTVPAVEVLGADVRSQLLWTGHDLAELRTRTDELPPEAEGEQHRTVMTFRNVSIKGIPSPVVELPETACVNCLLNWRAAPFAGRLVVLHSPRRLSTDVEEPIEPSRVHYLVLEPDGEGTAAGILPLAATTEPMGELRLTPAGDALAYETPDGVLLLDRDLRPAGGPFALEAAEGSWALEPRGEVVEAVWTDRHENVLARTFDLDGTPRGPAMRLSEGHPVAVSRAGGLDGAVLWDAGGAWFAAASTDGKLGGDLELPSERGGLLRPDALFVDGFAFLLAGQGRLDRLEVDCAR